MDKNTDEERRQAAFRWCENRIAVAEKALQVAIDRGKQVRIDLFKHELAGYEDYLKRLAKEMWNHKPNYSDILIATGKRYPARSNRYYWTKKGQPKLWKWRKRIGHRLTMQERHFLWPMTYLELRS